ncbi:MULTISPECIES: hypothetical protein [Nonomuraea]|uniref:Uncharacterized protein n=1 Tax=Nonomuraea mangrovi TaxID=2316207 RepID=A0ABW4SXS1_9ACTN
MQVDHQPLHVRLSHRPQEPVARVSTSMVPSVPVMAPALSTHQVPT